MVPLGVFVQEDLEQSIAKALTKANKAAESSRENIPPTKSKSESPELMEVHLDWHAPIVTYLRPRGLPDNKDENEQLRCNTHFLQE
jgi:hypothetical protein